MKAQLVLLIALITGTLSVYVDPQVEAVQGLVKRVLGEVVYYQICHV